MEENKKLCLECGSEIRGRTDKKFCNVRCKNKYNARLRTRYRQVQTRTIHILLTNYKILDKLLSEGKTVASLEELIYMGFIPSCVTGYRKGKYSHEEFTCFDIRYYQSNSRLFNLHRDDFSSILWDNQD